MKATASRDGVMRFTVKVPFRVGRQTLVDIIAYRTHHYGYDLPKTKKAVWEWAQNALHESGEGVWIGSDGHMEQTELDKIYALVDKLFPELQKQG
jgi:hypothetical protein